MHSLKRPSSKVVSSLHRKTSLSTPHPKNPLPESDDLFYSSPNELDAIQSSSKKKSKMSDQEKQVTQWKDDSLFSEVMASAGMILYSGNHINVLSCDQTKFQHKLIKSLNSSNRSTTNDALTDFFMGLEKYLKLPHRLKLSLLYTGTDPDCEVASRGNQDSLVRMLLNVDELQPRLVTLLTDILLELAYEQDHDTDSDQASLVLRNLRWLDHVVEPPQLNEALLGVLQAATLPVQQEIINYIPNIVTDEFHPKIADALTALYASTPPLCPAVLDALLNLTLTSDRLQEVHHCVLRTLHAAVPHHLPAVVRFLLHNTSHAKAYQVVSDIREKLHVPPSCTSQAGSSSTQPSQQRQQSTESAGLAVLVCSTVRTALLLHKYLTNAWLKAIDDVDVSSVRAEDLLLLVLVHEVVPARRRAVHSILRNKIRAGLRYHTLLKDTLGTHTAVMREYFDSVRKLAGVMLRSPEPAVTLFGAAIYRTVFECSADSSSYQLEVVEALIAHLGDDPPVRLAALTLLAALTHAHTPVLARFAGCLKSSLEQLERLSLQESRCLLDAVTAAAAFNINTELYASLAIYTRKLLNNGNVRYKRLGVLSSVLTLKNTRDSDSCQDGAGASSTGAGGGGEDTLEVVRACTAKCPPAIALFMDELASIILRDGINTRLERYLSGKLEEQFESVFIQDLESDSLPMQTSNTQVHLLLTFDLEVEEQAVIALNLAPLVESLELHRRQDKTGGSCFSDVTGLSADDNLQTIILTMAPHFRLLRMVVSHLHNGDLSAIDGLLGCPLLFPHRDILEPQAFASLGAEKQVVTLSCLFFAANWFRELINAFVTQKTPELKKKVYGRLRNLLEVEQQLCTLLPLCRKYVPHLAASHIDPSTAQPPAPVAAQSSVTGSKKRGRKPKQTKKKKTSGGGGGADTSVLPTQVSQLPASMAPDTQQQQSDGQEDNKAVADLSLYKAYLRELHLDVFCLLFKNMSLDTELQITSSHTHLSVPEAEFLLTDLNLKLMHVFGAAKRSSPLGKTVPGKDAGFWHLDLFTAEEIAMQAQRFVKPICVHLDKISTFFKSLIEDHDGVLDSSGVLNERTLSVARLQGQLLTALQLLLSWPELTQHLQLYSNILRMVCRKQWPDRSAEMLQQLSTDELLWGTFCYARNQAGALLELGSGVVVVRLLEAVVELARQLHCDPTPEESEESEEEQERHSYDYKLGDVVRSLLSRNWTTAVHGLPDRGTVYNQRVATLLQVWLKHSPRPLEVIREITTAGLDQYCAAGDKDPVSKTFPTLNKGTLVIYMSCLLSQLCNSIKKALAAAAPLDDTAAVTTQEETTGKFTVWESGVEVYSKLFKLVKTHHSRHLLSVALKHGRPFLELFLCLGMPVMDSCLKSKREEVCKLLKTLQTATRILQIVCTESKVKKDVTLTGYVPLMRRSLASLVFRVKAMLVHHGCSQAFWLGVLKNRNLDGEIISSQAQHRRDGRDEQVVAATSREAVEDTDEPEDESDTPLVDEDDRSDVELDDDDGVTSNSTAISGRKRKQVVEDGDGEDADEGDGEAEDGGTDYSASF